MGDLIRVDFHGDSLQATREPDGRVFVAVKPICENLGLQAHGQQEKLREAPWATAQNICVVAADGRNREVFAVDLDSLPMWLATINPRKVAPGIAAKLVRYQRSA